MGARHHLEYNAVERFAELADENKPPIPPAGDDRHGHAVADNLARGGAPVRQFHVQHFDAHDAPVKNCFRSNCFLIHIFSHVVF